MTTTDIVTPPATQQVVDAVMQRHERSCTPLTIAIDGVDGVGKTTFAALLARELTARGIVVHQASIDDFHHVRARRYRRGRMDPRGYVEDSFDHEAFARIVLDPLAPGGDRIVHLRYHDLESDKHISAPPVVIGQRDVLIVDGVFLQAEHLRDRWNLVVFLDAPFDATVARAIARDCDDDPRDLERAAELARVRYVPGQRLYLAEHTPRDRADIVVDCTDPAAARILRPAR